MVLGLLVAYLCIAVAGGVQSPKGEIFPFFNWSLFTYVSDHRQLIEIEILAINGVRLDAPTRFHDLPKQFAGARNKSVSILKLASRMAAAHIDGDQARFRSLRKVLEATYLAEAERLKYRLVANRYHPIERWRDGSIRSTIVIGEYTVDRSS
ncbi:MAG TPA: hypothetical protein VM325_09290 [Alphaproteobacteria bacterium]|nr:hypothetical protein [Alphaproteobacteria bacterium]